jgi:hypothetical protein
MTAAAVIHPFLALFGVIFGNEYSSCDLSLVFDHSVRCNAVKYIDQSDISWHIPNDLVDL